MSAILALDSLPPLAPGRSRLYLCRHGETDANARSLLQGGGLDAPLNALGRTQAEALARMLAAHAPPPDLIASSTLSRAVETADLVAAAANPAAAIERAQFAGLVEMSYGTLEGLPIADTRTELAALSAAWAAGDTRMPVGGDGGEHPEALLARAQATLWGGGLLGVSDSGRHVVAVAHSTFNRAVLAAATGKPLGAMFGIPQDNCCVNVLDYAVADGEVTVVAQNLGPLSSGL